MAIPPNNELPTSRRDAAKVNSRYYYTGEVCRNGHRKPRYTQSGKCSECARVAVKNTNWKRRRDAIKEAQNPDVGERLNYSEDVVPLIDHIIRRSLSSEPR